MTTPENLDLLFHHIEMLNMMLRPTRWHGKDIIWAGLPGAPTVREMFDALLHDIEKLRADNERLFVNETEALDRMTRAENRANLADAKLRNRVEEIEVLETSISSTHPIDEYKWTNTAEQQPAAAQVVLIWLQGSYSLAYLKNDVWYAIDRFHRGATIGAITIVRWWAALPPRPE